MVCCLAYTRVFLRDVREFPFDAVTTLCSAATQPQHHTLLHHDSIRTSQYGGPSSSICRGVRAWCVVGCCVEVVTRAHRPPRFVRVALSCDHSRKSDGSSRKHDVMYTPGSHMHATTETRGRLARLRVHSGTDRDPPTCLGRSTVMDARERVHAMLSVSWM
jgi:hypothetical protein